jgi:Fic family protein
MTTKETLKLIQQASGLTQVKLAEKLEVSFVAFNNWITGKSQPRKLAQKRIDRLYQYYIGSEKIPDKVLTAKKTLIRKHQKKHGNVLKKILSRKDVYEEFLLFLTFHSNRIEGSTLTQDDTAAILFQNASIPNHTLVEQLEAKNHQTALVYLFDYVNKKKPINEQLILRLHAILLNGIDSSAGSYRRHAVRIVGANVPTANYLRVPEKMKQNIRDAQKKKRDVIAHVAAHHSNFEQIHPFGDGNGRVGRLVIIAMLLERNFPPAVIQQDRRSVYMKNLNVSQTAGDFSPLEEVICEAVLKGYDLLK